MAEFYPSEPYVDWLGLDGYPIFHEINGNWYSSEPTLPREIFDVEQLAEVGRAIREATTHARVPWGPWPAWVMNEDGTWRVLE